MERVQNPNGHNYIKKTAPEGSSKRKFVRTNAFHGKNDYDTGNDMVTRHYFSFNKKKWKQSESPGKYTGSHTGRGLCVGHDSPILTACKGNNSFGPWH